jgi:hypothetical protein
MLIATSNTMASNDIEGYDLFQEKILGSGNNEQDAPKKPLEVTSLEFDSMDEKQRKEQEAVFKALEHRYCICNHKDEKHTDNTGSCNHNATRFNNGKIETFKCQCPVFKSKKQQREEIEADSNQGL